MSVTPYPTLRLKVTPQNVLTVRVLQGAAGPPGPPGPQGVQGDQGPAGADGAVSVTDNQIALKAQFFN